MVKHLIPFLAVGTTLAQQPGESIPATSAFEPTTHDVSRYQDIWSKSPFEFEIVVEEVSLEEDATFEDLRLSGYSDRGSYYVATIYDQKAPAEKIRIDSRKSPDENGGFEFVEVIRGVSYKQTKISLTKNGFPGKVGYDNKRLSTPLAAAAGGNGRKPAARAQNRAAKTRQAIQAAARAQNNNRNRQGNNNARNTNNNANANTTPGNANNTNAAGGTDRNAVIQRLLERARQNQGGGGNTATPNANGTTNDNATPRPRRRRVVLPPSAK